VQAKILAGPIYQTRRKTSPFRAERLGALPPGKSFGQRHLFAL
jgi:hypothetical protein